MSSYFIKAKNPKTGKWETAFAHDNFYGNHKYGIWFGDDVYPESEVELGEITEPPQDSYIGTFTWNENYAKEVAEYRKGYFTGLIIGSVLGILIGLLISLF